MFVVLGLKEPLPPLQIPPVATVKDPPNMAIALLEHSV